MGKLLKVICEVVCVFVNHAHAPVYEMKKKNLFRAGINKWLRRKYFVEKSSDAIISKRGWVTVERNYHSPYSILDFDWLIHLQITACKYRSAANN